MFIDGKSIGGEDRKQVNTEFSRAWNMARAVTRKEMVDKWMFGPECQELVVSGELWIVCDTDHAEPDEFGDKDTSAVLTYFNELRGKHERWIADRPLFKLVASLSPLESCEAAEKKLRKRFARTRCLTHSNDSTSST